ncbi:hypothetical protein HZB01_01470 [Candidatus Woesearchaeota archaeon]|nr:hypothetical protein [Candidatus Woesearchaeota archaeon]
MRKIVAVSSLLILGVILLLSGCAKSPETPPSPNGTEQPPVSSDFTSVVIKINGTITEETLAALKEQGVTIDSVEQGGVYGNVVFGTVNKSDVGALNQTGVVEEGVSERDYKTEVLTDVAVGSGVGFQRGSRDLGFLVDGQIVMDEQRRAEGKGPGPKIYDSLGSVLLKIL